MIGEKNNFWKGGPTKLKCIFCDKDYFEPKCSVSRSKFCSRACCAKFFHTGEKCHLWKGGITPLNVKVRHSEEYKLWRESVFKRDNYTCIWCGIKNGKGKTIILHADHIKPFAYYPELRFAIDNGRTLCKSCHEKTDTYGSKIKIYDK